jgi:hypothetical protein
MSDSQLANHQDGTAMRMLVAFHLAQLCAPANGRTIRWQQKGFLVMVNTSIRTQRHTAAPGLAFNSCLLDLTWPAYHASYPYLTTEQDSQG